MRWKSLLLGIMLLCSAALSSCALLPEEEAVRVAPRVNTVELTQFNTTAVMRGDLIESTKVTAQYQPLKTASLSFAAGGEYMEKMLVEVGDAVEQGQLLAHLKLENLETRIASTTNTITRLKRQLKYIEDQYELECRRLAVNTKTWNTVDRQKAEDELRETYAMRTREVNESLMLQNMALETLYKDLQNRQIVAPFSGNVTFAAKIKEGDLYTIGTTVFNIVDTTMSLFRVNTDLWEAFEDGEVYEIVVKNVAYAAVAVSPQELGLEEERVPGKKANVYFALKEPNFEIEDGTYGTVAIVLQEYRDVLYVPEKAIATIGDESIVYYQKEDGTRGYKAIVTGVTVDGFTQIISGLNEGDLIIAN